MSGQAKGQPFGAALFPFLAVLICTTGALAVLLVSALHRTGVELPLITAAQENEEDRALRERLEDAQWRREMLEKSRAEKTEELSETRSRVAHLAEHTQRLAAQATELLERAKAIDEGKKLREEDFAAARAEADKLKAEIAKKKAELEKTKKPQDGQEWYALIPYDGRAGTRRRPIYVECTEFGVVIQPEGILLRADDFNGPLGPGNPLDSALRAIREHWEKTAGSKAAQPYPLLVVRPSGVVAFGAAKAAISAWDDEWGYELISDDKQLDFGQPDPALNATLSKTVAVSRQRQAAIVAMMPRRFQGDEPLKSFTPEPSIAASSSRYIGGGSGGTTGGSGPGGGSGSLGNGIGASGVGAGTVGGVGGQAGGGMARTNGGYGNGYGATGANGGSGYSAGGTGMGGMGVAQAGGTGSGGGNGTNGYGGAASGGGSSGSGIPSVTSSLNGGSAGQRADLAGRNAASALGNTGSGGAGGEGFLGSAASASGGGPGGSSYGAAGGTGGSGQAGAAGNQAGGGQYASASGGQYGSASGGQYGSASGGQSFAGSGSGGQSGSSMGSSASGGGGASSFGSSGASSGAQGGAGSPFGGSSMSASSPGGMGVPSLNFGGTKSSQPAGASKAGPGGSSSTAKRGKNWGLPQAKVNQTGVTRLIRVNLQPDRVVMLPEAGDSRAPQVVKIAPEMTPDDVNHFVNAVQDEVKGWGLAVADGYWKPKLQVDVAPGAERQYLNLETALNGSGIEITRR